MQWTVQVTVALLNILWIVFFLTPDPFSLSVQRRSAHSSEEEMLFQEFCVEPKPHMNPTSAPRSVNITANKTDGSDTAAEVNQESNFTVHETHSIKTDIEHDCQCNYTNIPPTDWYSLQLLDIGHRPPAPGCEPKIIMTFPDMEVCMDVQVYFSAIAQLASDWEEPAAASHPDVPELTTAASPPVQGLASSEVTTASGLIAPHHPKTPVRQNDNLYPNIILGRTAKTCCFTYFSRRMPIAKIKGYMVQSAASGCPRDAIILFTTKHKRICVNPRAVWVKRMMTSAPEIQMYGL